MKRNILVTTIASSLVVLFSVISGCNKNDDNITPEIPVGIPVQTTVQEPVNLVIAGNFAVLAASGITNTGATSITGNVGVCPGTQVAGFPPGIITGTLHNNDTDATLGKVDLTMAYNDAAGRTCTDIVTLSGNIGGLTLTPGLYKSTSSLAVSSGDLTLDALGNPNAVFIIQMASTLTTTSGRRVILSGGARASNIIWQVGSSATFGTGTAFKGTVMAMQSITFNTGATLQGRALARTGAIVMAGNTIVAE